MLESGTTSFGDTYLLFDIVSVCIMLFLGVLSVKAAASGNVEARLVCYNFILFGLLALYSILMTNGMANFTSR